MNTQHRTPRQAALRATLVLGTLATLAIPAAATPIPSGSISGASFKIDLAAFTGARTVNGVEVNRARLYDLTGGGLVFDMSDALFGAPGSPAAINQGTLTSDVITIQIPAAFYPAMLNGMIGFSATFTDTFDNMFAIDFLSIVVDDGAQIFEAEYGTGGNDGYGIGLFDGQNLPGTLASGVLTQNGSGFDERIASKSMNIVIKIPAPGSGAGLLTGAALLLRRRRR